MAFSEPQVKWRKQFSPLPQEDKDIKQNQPNTNPVDKCLFSKFWEWEGFMVALRFFLVAPLIIMLALRQTNSNKPVSDHIPPKFFLDSLRVPSFNVANGKGELSATWDVKLMISKVMNLSNINIQRLEVTIWYKHNKTLLTTFIPIKPHGFSESQVFPVVEAGENKMLHFQFSTWGWEKDQPAAVVDAMAKDRKKGVTRFGLLMRVKGDLEFQEWTIPFLMYPNCMDLVVQFPSSTELGQAPTLIHGNHTECLGVTKWGRVKRL